MASIHPAWHQTSSMMMDYAGSALEYDDATSDAGMSVDSFSAFSSYGSASSRTTMSEMGRSASPSPSVFSVTSSIREQAYRDEYGRAVNNYSEVYRLPADNEEVNRLDQQHELFKYMLGKYPAVMREVLQEQPHADPKAILDLGCGSGTWIIEAARDFPHCSAVGVDLVPIPDIVNIPTNMRCEVDDLNLGLDHFYGDFDVVHARLIASGVKDYRGLIDQISRVLRPGGVLILLDTDFLVADVNYHTQVPNTSLMQPPWLQRFLAFVNMAIKKRGGNIEACEHMHEWLAEHPAYEQIEWKDHFMGISPWMQGRSSESQRQRHIAQQMRADLYEFLKSAKPLLLGSGMPEALYNELAFNTHRELKDAKEPGYIRVKYLVARRKLVVPEADTPMAQ